MAKTQEKPIEEQATEAQEQQEVIDEMMACPMCGAKGPFAVRVYGFFELGEHAKYDFDHTPGEPMGYFDDTETHCRSCGHTDRACVFKEKYRNYINES